MNHEQCTPLKDYGVGGCQGRELGKQGLDTLASLHFALRGTSSGLGRQWNSPPAFFGHVGRKRGKFGKSIAANDLRFLGERSG